MVCSVLILRKVPRGALEIYSVVPRFTGFFYSQCCIGAPRISWRPDGDDHSEKKCQRCRVFQGSDTPQGRRRADSLRVQDIGPTRLCAGMVAASRSRDRGSSGNWPADPRSRYPETDTPRLCQRCKRHRGMGTVQDSRYRPAAESQAGAPGCTASTCH